jgi:hypothetical protein
LLDGIKVGANIQLIEGHLHGVKAGWSRQVGLHSKIWKLFLVTSTRIFLSLNELSSPSSNEVSFGEVADGVVLAGAITD